MKNRILLSSAAATILTGMFTFTGCGSSSNNSNSDVVASSEQIAKVEEVNKVSTPQTTIKKEVIKVEQPQQDKYCMTLEGGKNTKSRAIQGSSVIAYDEEGNVINKAISNSEGEVCFDEEPANVKVGYGYDGEARVGCGDKMEDFVPTLDCSKTWGKDGLIKNSEEVRSLFCALFDTIGVPTLTYKKVIDDAMEADTMVEAIKILTTFKWDHDDNGLTSEVDFGSQFPWKKQIIKEAAEIIASPYATTPEVQRTALSAIDGLVKMGPNKLGDKKNALSMSDLEFLAKLQSNLYQIQDFTETFKDKNGGVDTRALAAKLLLGDFIFGDNTTQGDKAAQDYKIWDTKGGVNKDGDIATNYRVSNCIDNKYLACGPRANIFSMNGLIDRDLGGYQEVLDKDTKADFYGPLSEIGKQAVCDVIDQKASFNYAVTDISGICTDSFKKYKINGEEIEGKELPATFSSSQKYLKFTNLALDLTTAEQFKLLAGYMSDAIVYEFSPTIDKSMYGQKREFITTIAIESPKDACDIENRDANKEFLTITFNTIYDIDSDGNYTVKIKGANSPTTGGIDLTDPLNCVKCKNSVSHDGEMMLTAKMDKGDGNYETITINFPNPIEYTLKEKDGSFILRPLDLFDKIFTAMYAHNRDYQNMDIASLQNILLNAFTNKGKNECEADKTRVVKTSISMLYDTDVRYISYGENPAEVTDDAALHTGMISMREAEENAEILKDAVKGLQPAKAAIGMYNVDADLIAMLSLGTTVLPQLPYDATPADAATAAAAAAAALPNAIAAATASTAQVVAEATQIVADATANVATVAANPLASDEAQACAAHSLEEANEVLEKASELAGLGQTYMVGCGAGYGTAFHAGGALVPTTTDSTTDAWVECVSTFFEDYATVRVALADAAETNDDIEVIATHSNDIGDFTTYDVLRTINIYDRIKMLKQKAKLTDDEKKELAHLQNRANFIMNPATMNPEAYALNKGSDAGGFDTEDNDFYADSKYDIDDFYRKVLASQINVNAIEIESWLDCDTCGCDSNDQDEE